MQSTKTRVITHLFLFMIIIFTITTPARAQALPQADEALADSIDQLLSTMYQPNKPGAAEYIWDLRSPWFRYAEKHATQQHKHPGQQ